MSQVIPKASVEAAAKALDEAGYGIRGQDELRLALEAAAPHMLAESWEQGAVAGWNQSGEGWNAEYPDESTGKCSVDLSANPHRTTK